ncbi:MAG: hypothetical protein Q4G45_14400 [Actinomycetia bacterium]|nr:hypothetical protein [Actinomycetes bacterium]
MATRWLTVVGEPMTTWSSQTQGTVEQGELEKEVELLVSPTETQGWVVGQHQRWQRVTAVRTYRGPAVVTVSTRETTDTLVQVATAFHQEVTG